MNCSLILEEAICAQREKRQPLYIDFLASKSTADVVSHDSLLRNIYHTRIEGIPWLLTRSLHEEAAIVIKWGGATSEPFQVQRGETGRGAEHRPV